MEGFELYIVRMLYLFMSIIILLVGFLCYLYLSMRRAYEREAESLAFSDLVIEGMETERRRVSRELHDAVLPLVRNSEVSALIRSICAGLAPPDFAALSLKDSLADLCVHFSQRTGIECACSIGDTLDFSALKPEHQLHLYRMVQESLTNIEKHSGAQKAAMVARRNAGGAEETILICVSDDGVGVQRAQAIHNMPDSRGKAGLNNKESSGEGLGMMTMRQRAVILGAKLDFISESGNGLMVRIELPPPPQMVNMELSDG